MSAQSMTRQVSGAHIGPIGTLLLGAAALLAALGVVAAANLAADTRPGVQAPAPAFNAVEFRAAEKLPIGASEFNYAKFRADEKATLANTGFDAVKFRADEKASLANPGFDDVTFRAQEKSLR